jgi:hypothetical protein
MLFLATACAPAPQPEPTASVVPPTASATPTPTPEPIVEPEAAFDVTCADVTAEMTTLVGSPAGVVDETLSLVSSAGWYPGPAQHMFQRAGGIACSTGDSDRSWEVTIVPGAQTVTAGAASRNGFSGEEARCDMGRCFVQILDGEILVSSTIIDPALTAEDTQRIEQGLRSLAASAASTLRDVELPESDIVGAECARLLTAEELAAQVGGEAFLITTFGGWGIPSEVYQVVNGSRLCYYSSGADVYESQGYLTITTLPGGAWAFEQLTQGSTVAIEGADAAIAGFDEFDQPVLDLRVGPDWIRLTTYEGAGISDLTPIAQQIVQNFTVGRPAPQ